MSKMQLMIEKLFINLIKGKRAWLCAKHSGNVLKIRTKVGKAIKDKINVIQGIANKVKFIRYGFDGS